jgi:hypothetical protein
MYNALPPVSLNQLRRRLLPLAPKKQKSTYKPQLLQLMLSS